MAKEHTAFNSHFGYSHHDLFRHSSESKSNFVCWPINWLPHTNTEILHVNIYLTYQLWIYGKLSKPTNQPAKSLPKALLLFSDEYHLGMNSLRTVCNVYEYVVYATQKIACDLKSFAFVHDPKTLCVYP